jgi:hypothetical protein
MDIDEGRATRRAKSLLSAKEAAAAIASANAHRQSRDRHGRLMCNTDWMRVTAGNEPSKRVKLAAIDSDGDGNISMAKDDNGNGNSSNDVFMSAHLVEPVSTTLPDSGFTLMTAQPVTFTLSDLPSFTTTTTAILATPLTIASSTSTSTTMQQ